MLLRLDKFISNQLNISRSDVRKAIFKGEVLVDGKPVLKPDTKIDTNICIVSLNGDNINYKEYVYIVLNKPKGIISASTDKTRETVVDLVPKHLSRRGLSPVGRLDRDTTGLLIITDDGEFAHRVISPKSNLVKRYNVLLDGEVDEGVVTAFKNGVTLHDGTKCLPAEIEVDKANKCKATVCIVEGKYHQIKRMFGVVGLGVVELHRSSIGPIVLDENLKSGECRELTSSELDEIRKDYNNS